MKTQLISPDLIVIPDFVERSTSKVTDDRLRQSIEQGGIQQPLIVIEESKKLVDGLVRIRIARLIGIKVPVAYDHVPPGRDEDDYIRQIRFILDHHRQDLLPSQKADLIVTLKQMFGMNHTQVARYLGINQDSVTNWLAIKQYIEPVAKAVDQGLVTMHAARTFDGLTEQGQRHVWKHHAKELMTEAGGRIHKTIRAQYSPSSHPQFYRNAELIQSRLDRKSGKRTGKSRPSITKEEKRRLMTSFEMRELELKESEREYDQLKGEINAAIAPIAAIMRNEKLWSMVPKETQEEMERFREVYI